MKKNLSLRKIAEDEHLEVQKILDSAPTYYMLVEGVPLIEGGAKKLFSELPPNGTYENKHVYFVEFDQVPIGVAQIDVGYPNQQTAFVGLFLLNEKYHGKGLGQSSFALLEKHIKENFSVDRIELAVNDTNDIGMKFWSKLGFVKNGRSRENVGVKVTSTVYVLAKNII